MDHAIHNNIRERLYSWIYYSVLKLNIYQINGVFTLGIDCYYIQLLYGWPTSAVLTWIIKLFNEMLLLNKEALNPINDI